MGLNIQFTDGEIAIIQYSLNEALEQATSSAGG